MMLRNFMLTALYILFVLIIVDSKSAGTRNVNGSKPSRSVNRRDVPLQSNDGATNYGSNKYLRQNDDCWITLGAKAHFEKMEELEAQYAAARKDYQEDIDDKRITFDTQLLQIMLKTRGRVSGREEDYDNMPAGLNLGGYCMMRMENSVLFFHRMKLRNNTRFRINSLNTDLSDMQIFAQLSLNDLHLFGNYERATTGKDPSDLYYAPTYGQVEILMRNVQYKLEGRLRLLEDSLFIVLVNSEIDFYDALLTYKNNATHCAKPIRLRKHHFDEFVERMKSDLDEWLRDYFNEHLIFFSEVGQFVNTQIREYEKKKVTALNNYVEEAITFLKHRLREVNATAVRLPSFSIYSVSGLEIKLNNGVLRGLTSMYRRSIATSKKDNNIRHVDAIIGFSSLKVAYKYSAFLTIGVPPVSGMLILTADELTAHLGISLVKDPETVELQVDFLQQMKPESLTVEGPANRMIANFKHVLEQHIISIMTNTVYHNIRALSSLTKCHPDYFGYPDDEDLPSGRDYYKEDSVKGPRSPDYVIRKEDSIEVVLPPDAQGKSRKIHFGHLESVNITNLNK